MRRSWGMVVEGSLLTRARPGTPDLAPVMGTLAREGALPMAAFPGSRHVRCAVAVCQAHGPCLDPVRVGNPTWATRPAASFTKTSCRITPLKQTPPPRSCTVQVVSRCVAMAGVLGAALAVVLALGRGSIPGMFSRDPRVLELVTSLLPFVIVSQPINAMAFVWDGVLFGAGGFR